MFGFTDVASVAKKKWRCWKKDYNERRYLVTIERLFKMSLYQYPLNLRFKLIALAPRIIVTDANGQEQLFVHQRTWKLKEDVPIYNNQKKERELFRIQANRIIDFSALYRFKDSGTGNSLGAVKRKGMRSIWRATYFSENAAGQTTHHIKEDNPWTKVGNALLSEIPIVGMFAGYFFNPSYTVYRGDQREDESQPVVKLAKNAAFFESSYTMELVQPSISQEEELQLLLTTLMVVQLERWRG